MNTPTTPTPPEGLTDEQLFKLAAAAIDGYDSIAPGQFEPETWIAVEAYGSELIAYARAAIAADRAARPAPAPAADVAQVLAGAGVFKGSHGLRGLLDADTFWEQQPYGTRLCYGDGIADYLQRGVLHCAVTLLEQFSLVGWVVPTVEQVTPAPEELEAQFRAWFQQEHGLPPSSTATAHAAAFALHLLKGVQ